MTIVFPEQQDVVARPSIILAGPTPRSRDLTSWRRDALELLRGLKFQGTVFVPERPDWASRFSYSDQVEWEFAGLERCSIIVFWVPRDPLILPGFTSNVEFGRYVGSGRCVYGRPEGTPHTRYLDWLYTKMTGKHPEVTLVEALRAAVAVAS